MASVTEELEFQSSKINLNGFTWPMAVQLKYEYNSLRNMLKYRSPCPITGDSGPIERRGAFGISSPGSPDAGGPPKCPRLEGGRESMCARGGGAHLLHGGR